jgi:hypothetical protein
MRQIMQTLQTLAVLVTIIGLLLQMRRWRIEQHQARAAANLSLLAQIHLKLSEAPEAFRVYDITGEQMKASGISARELAYLVANFTAGQIFYEGSPDDPKRPFPEDNHRTRICRTTRFKGSGN